MPVGDAISESGRIGGGSYINADGVHPTVQSAFPVTGINDKGQAVGLDNIHFSLDRTNGFFYDGNQINSIHLVPSDLNDSGEIVGNTYQFVPIGLTGSVQPGPALLISPGGTSSVISFPGSESVSSFYGGVTLYSTTAEGISNSGAIAGTYGSRHGFYLKDGIYTALDVPGAATTQARDINDQEDVVGTYLKDATDRGFVWHQGTFDTVSVPGSIGTYVNGINNAGEIVGTFVRADNTTGAFAGEHLNEVFRFLDTVTSDHFYTTNPGEKASILANLPTFRYEGVSWAAPDKRPDTVDAFRFYDTLSKTHFLTTSIAERDQILSTLPTYSFEGVAFQTYAHADEPGERALDRFFNTNTGTHHYAADSSEVALIKSGAVGNGWVEEGPSLIVHDVGGSLYIV